MPVSPAGVGGYCTPTDATIQITSHHREISDEERIPRAAAFPFSALRKGPKDWFSGLDDETWFWMNTTARRPRKRTLHLAGASAHTGVSQRDLEADESSGRKRYRWRDDEGIRTAIRHSRQELCERLKRGAYRAPPVRRVEIPKGTGKVGTRPLGIPPVLS